MNSNEADKANKDIYDDFNLKKPFGFQKYFSAVRVNF